MSLRGRPVAIWAFPLVALALALFVLGTNPGGVAAKLRGILFDYFETSHPRAYVDTTARSGHPVRVLDIDPKSTERFGPWPWPHAIMAGLVDAMRAQGASVVVFITPFEKPDPISSKNFLPLVPPGPTYDGVRGIIERLPSPDQAFATALSKVKAVTGFVLGDARPSRTLTLKAAVDWSGKLNPFVRGRAFDQASGSIDVIEAASAGVGAVNLNADPDGEVRRMPLVFRLRDKAVPSLDAEMLRLVEGKDAITLNSDDGQSTLFTGKPGVASVDTEHGTLATAPDGSFWIAYSGANPARNITATALATRTLPRGALRNAIVYIGAPDDLVDTPMGMRPVAEVHAEAAENLLLGTVLRRPASAVEGELLCLLLFGLGCIALFVKLGARWSALYVAGMIGVMYFASWRFYVSQGVLFDSLGFSLGLLAVWLAAGAARAREITGQVASLRLAFADALPAPVIARLARDPQRMRLDGENRTVTYLSCGVRGFADLASSFRDDPAAFTRLMQRVLDPLMHEARKHGGVIDKLTPEGFTAFWNAPLDDAEHAVHACEAATGLMEAIARTNELITHERRADGSALPPVEIGIGVATSLAISGGFKTHGRTAYSVTGDCTVLAGRIQQISGQYGPAVVVSEETRKAAERGFAFLEVDCIAIGSRDETVALYALLGNPVMRASPKFRALATFHEHIFQSIRARQWHKARELIAQCRKLSGASQKLYDLHLARIAFYEDNPPAEDWDGAYRPVK